MSTTQALTCSSLAYTDLHFGALYNEKLAFEQCARSYFNFISGQNTVPGDPFDITAFEMAFIVNEVRYHSVRLVYQVQVIWPFMHLTFHVQYMTLATR